MLPRRPYLRFAPKLTLNPKECNTLLVGAVAISQPSALRNTADRWRVGSQDLSQGNISGAERRPQVSPMSAASSPVSEPVADERRWAAIRELAGVAEPQRKLTLLRFPKGGSIFSLSGGTGKTTICATLASCLRGRGERLLIADFCDESLLAH